MSDKKGDFDIEVGGYQVTFDLNCFTRREYRQLLEPGRDEREDDGVIARATGLSVEQIEELGNTDWRRLWVAFFTKNREPLSDPNWASAFSST